MKAAERGASGIMLAAMLTNATAILINYSTSQPPEVIADNIWLAWILLPVLTAALAVSQVRPRWRSADRYEPTPSIYRKYNCRALSIDRLPVSNHVRILFLEFGEGPQKVVISDLSNFELGADGLISAARDQEVVSRRSARLPHRFHVCGRKRRGRRTMVYVITDLAYVQAIRPFQMGANFVARCKLDRGGILPFLDIDAYHKGRIVVRSELGALGLIVAVEYLWGRPVARSRYVCGIRAGIRYPDDLWRSTRTGKAITSTNHRETARVAFQSRQEGGLSSDVFACDLDGGHLRNLTPKAESSYDGFFRDRKEVVRWTEDGSSLRIASHPAGQTGTRVVRDEPGQT